MAIREHDAEYLWALEKNTKAIRFYERYGFHLTGEKVPEEGRAALAEGHMPLSPSVNYWESGDR